MDWWVWVVIITGKNAVKKVQPDKTKCSSNAYHLAETIHVISD